MKKIVLVLFIIVTANASFSQTSKNNWLLGGSASYSSTKEGDLTNTVLDISPRIGYFIANNLALGVNVGINKMHDEGNDASNVSFGPYVRYYFLPVGNNVKFFGNGQVIFGNEDEGMGNSQLSGWGLAVGPAIFINKSIAFETSIAYTSTQAGIEQVKDNTLSINFGFQIHFGK
jgi:hypothetical protein